MQKGYIYQTEGAWHVRYRVDGKQVSRKLADNNDQYRAKRSVRPLADEVLDPLNQGLQVNGPMTPATVRGDGVLPEHQDQKESVHSERVPLRHLGEIRKMPV